MIKLFVIQIFIFLFSIGNFAYGVDFNDDIEKVELDYYYYEGFGEDKVVQSIEDGSWHILKPDGSLINLTGNYLAYAGMEGKTLNFHDDYYRFVIGNDSYDINYSTRFIYVDKNGLECFVDGYTYVDPTKGENYFIVTNMKGNGYETGLYHKYNKTLVIPPSYDTLNYINDDRITACKNDKYGLINIKQEEIIPFEYNYLDYINDNFIIAINEDGKYGVININNEVKLAFEYDNISNDVYKSNDYYKVSINNKVGLVEMDGFEIVVPLEYDNIEYFSDEIAVALKDDQMGLIDVNGKEVVPFIYDYIMYNDAGFMVFKDELAGFLNRKGKIILPVKYYNISEIKNGFITAVIKNENNELKYVIYDLNGKEIVSPIYDHVDYYTYDKYMIVKNGWQANLVDKTTGERLLDNSDKYTLEVKYINDKYYAGGSTSSGYAIVNFAGQRLTSEIYNDISIINVNGENLLAAKYNTERFNTHFDYFKQTKGPSTWAREEVIKAIENNLVPFELQAAYTFNIKRYEFCSIIVDFLEEYYNTTRENIIRDNEIDVVNPPVIDGFNDDIVICLNLGIVSGRGNGIFDGDSEITREEAAVMLSNLSRYLGNDTVAEERHINDKSDVSPWAKDAVNFVLQNRIMQGVGYGMFYPKSNLTREQTYIIVYRMLEAIRIAKTDKVTLLTNLTSEEGMYKGFAVQTEDKSQSFPWVNVTNPTYSPTISMADIDGDGKDEIVVVLVIGYGTGVHDEEIHILNFEDLTELNIEDPFEAINNWVSSSIITVDNKVNITIKWNENTLEKSFKKSDAGMWFDKISFHSIIHYEIKNNRIIAKVEGQMSPAGFPVTAIVEYDENLKVINIEIVDSELDKSYDKYRG